MNDQNYTPRPIRTVWVDHVDECAAHYWPTRQDDWTPSTFAERVVLEWPAFQPERTGPNTAEMLYAADTWREWQTAGRPIT